ncbi:hypothetical protein CDCA_CDCA04G1308 [Cyanidium caldarium]|uniref:Uncharacterized protein n=1 Tax=Cyanidium caldarium TaxID=2771 RepID=A0AAV9IT73_CYACA|nr:hypothetical protein CDCA_CDCA04G1308 [Cyanidium caldarium]|eukprot:ctg_1736.g522
MSSELARVVQQRLGAEATPTFRPPFPWQPRGSLADLAADGWEDGGRSQRAGAAGETDRYDQLGFTAYVLEPSAPPADESLAAWLAAVESPEPHDSGLQLASCDAPEPHGIDRRYDLVARRPRKTRSTSRADGDVMAVPADGAPYPRNRDMWEWLAAWRQALRQYWQQSLLLRRNRLHNTPTGEWSAFATGRVDQRPDTSARRRSSERWLSGRLPSLYSGILLHARPAAYRLWHHIARPIYTRASEGSRWAWQRTRQMAITAQPTGQRIFGRAHSYVHRVAQRAHCLRAAGTLTGMYFYVDDNGQQAYVAAKTPPSSSADAAPRSRPSSVPFVAWLQRRHARWRRRRRLEHCLARWHAADARVRALETQLIEARATRDACLEELRTHI